MRIAMHIGLDKLWQAPQCWIDLDKIRFVIRNVGSKHSLASILADGGVSAMHVARVGASADTAMTKGAPVHLKGKQ
jgi:hypothetical protein